MSAQTTKPAPLLSHADFTRAHQELIASLDKARDDETARAKAIEAAALTSHASAHGLALTNLETAQRERATAFGRHAADTLAAPLAAWCKEPTRDATRAVQAAFEALDSEKQRLLAQPLERELVWAMARIYIARDPKCLPRFAVPENYYNVVADAGVNKAAHLLGVVMRRGTGDTASQLHALEELERTVSALAAGPAQGIEHRAAERFEAIASGLSPEQIERKLRTLNDAAFVAQHGTVEERQKAYFEYETRTRSTPITGFL